jgi:hypothetical protein
VISFRQHVVTIVAVFLALALGMLAGSAFVQPRLVDQLQARVDEQVGTIDGLRETVGEIRAQMAAEEAFADSAMQHLVHDRLLGRTVVIVAQDGVEEEVVVGSEQALTQAGAQVVALRARDTLRPENEGDQQALATLLGLPGVDPAELPARAAQAIADRLAEDGRRGLGPDILHDLLDAGHLVPIGPGVSDGTVDEIGGPDQIVVVLGGGQKEEPLMGSDEFAVPLTERVAELGLPVAAGESAVTLLPFVGVLREGDLSGLVTVDDLDHSMGGAALVLGLEELLATGLGGDYGVKDDADPLPPVP